MFSVNLRWFIAVGRQRALRAEPAAGRQKLRPQEGLSGP
jgi:hypothetical protein